MLAVTTSSKEWRFVNSARGREGGKRKRVAAKIQPTLAATLAIPCWPNPSPWDDRMSGANYAFQVWPKPGRGKTGSGCTPLPEHCEQAEIL